MMMTDDDLARMNRVLRHRLRNLASGLRNALSLLGQELDARLKPSEKEYFPLMRQECDELQKITERLALLFDDLPAGAPAAVREVVENTVLEIRRDYPAISFQVETEQTADSCRLEFSRWVQVIFSELLRNAAQAAAGGGNALVLVRGSAADGGVRFLVADNGHGVAPADMAHIFQPFFTTRPRQLGIGLAIARRWTERLGGNLAPAPQSPLAGACMELFLPAKPAE